MKLDYLLNREDFAIIFNTSISDYLENSSNWTGNIFWNKKNIRRDEYFLVNKRLNLIFPANSSFRNLKNIVVEYSYNSKFFTRWLQSIYVFLAISKVTRKIFAFQYFYIEPIPKILKNACIIPGNHSIRVVDMLLNECLVLRKTSYRKDKLENLVKSRCRFTNIPGPQLYEFDLENGWYREERVFGIPIDRTMDEVAVKNSLHAARKCMLEIYTISRQEIPLSDWMEIKSKDLVIGIDNMPNCYSSKERLLVLTIFNKLSRLVRDLGINDFNVISSITHGDFQPANILIPLEKNNKDVYLIDWEYSKRRCQHYDNFVFMLRTRSPKGLSHRVLSNIKNTSKIQEALIASGIKESATNKYKLYIYLFLIEEIFYRLEDTDVPNLRKTEPGFITLLNELSKMFGDI